MPRDLIPRITADLVGLITRPPQKFLEKGLVWHLKPFSKFEKVETYTMRPQIGASILYQF